MNSLMIDLGSRFMKQGEFVGSDGENFIVELSEENVYSLDAAAYYVWALCDGSKTVDDIIKRLVEDLGLERSEIEQPVISIIEALLKAELIKEVSM
ncbi:MAG: PqqD family protein [Desulfurococcaceae archaeon]|nr:PqqD family protein [Desulfurococcaceae archaeon]